ncbi:trypsin-like peptidase domain-containing protein [Streptomyces sp. ME02-8801-2C]|uniref:VMAP-C domain-containing protein n=1 Tax=Streptomyces sp. ME02-8801-2C TaxID=3028680 RepID=UPI0029A09292|nr:trypsin-like peptidase domain-containing protein [Streptomyces sp. ME02-8801-2C]MDX3456716.1 trypsin-like peptidase domain-containing protein [Streptomyces sp. ME02-8801-2C]
MTSAKLDALVVRATVRIGPDDEPGTLWGSGFFVAPGWLLTCRHILPLKDGPEGVGSLRVQGYDGLDVRARPAYWLGGGTDPEQDLVLIRLTEDVPHACVRLTDHYDRPNSVAAYGWRPTDGLPKRWSGETDCNGTDGGYGLTLGPLAEIPHGASGGPLLDRERGLVAGIVKARRVGKDGGLAVAVTALRGFRRAVPVGEENGLGADPYAALIRAHDIWHSKVAGAVSWVKAQTGVAVGGDRSWGPGDSAKASALLAGLPEPRSSAELQGLIGHVVGDDPLWTEEAAPRDWRDGHGWLYDHPEGADLVALHYLRVVAQVCGPRAPDAAAALERWVEQRAEALPGHLRALLMGVVAGAPAPWGSAGADVWTDPRIDGFLRHGDGDDADYAHGSDDSDGPVVAVELEPDLFRPHDRFHWRIWTWTGGPETVRAGDEGSDPEGDSLADLPSVLNEPLARTFGRLDNGRRARLELAVPVEHFGINAHLWLPGPVVPSLRAHLAERPFGVHRQVVVRCLKRRGEPTAVWRERWRAVAEGEPKALPVISDAYAGQALDAAPPGAVPVLCRPPAESTGPLAQAVAAGYGVIFWNLQAEHTHGCGTDCRELHDRTAELLSSAGRATALPERVRALREGFRRADPDADWVEHLALLYDDPGRPIPHCDDLLESP